MEFINSKNFIKENDFIYNTVTRLTDAVLAPKHNPVDMPPHPE